MDILGIIWNLKTATNILKSLGVIITPFVLEKCWHYFTSKKQCKADYVKLKSKVLTEINYNIQPGVGNKKAPFLLTSHQQLLEYPNLEANLKDKLQEIVNAALICNGCNGERPLKISPGRVNGLEKELLDLLNH